MKNLYKFFTIVCLVLFSYNISCAKDISYTKEKILRDVQKNQDKYNQLAKQQTEQIENDVNNKVKNSLGNLPQKYSEELRKNQDNFIKEREEALQNAYKQGEAIQKDVNKTIKDSYKNFRL